MALSHREILKNGQFFISHGKGPAFLGSFDNFFEALSAIRSLGERDLVAW